MNAPALPRGQRGFTLVEVLIVIAVAGLLAVPVGSWLISTLENQEATVHDLRKSVSSGQLAATFSRDVSSASQVLVGDVESDCTGGGGGAGGDVVLAVVPSSSAGRVLYVAAAGSDEPARTSLWRRECDDGGALRASSELYERVVPGSIGADCLGAGDQTGPCAEAEGEPNLRVRLALTSCPTRPLSAASSCDPSGGVTEDVELHAKRRVTPGYEQYAGQAPVAQIQVSPRVGYLDTQFTFDASASRGLDAPGVSVEWEFPSVGATAEGVTVTRGFDSTGDHEALLRITDGEGRTSEAVARIRVINRHPRAVAVARESDGGLVFDGSGSSHPDGLALSYQWSFGEGLEASGAVVPSPFAPDAVGRRRAVLTVTDSAGNSDTVAVVHDFGIRPTGPITIEPEPIEFEGKLPTVGSVGLDRDPLEVTFTGAAGDEGLGWRLTRHGTEDVVATAANGGSFTHFFGPLDHGEFDVMRTDGAGDVRGDVMSFRVNAAPLAAFDVTAAAAGSATDFDGTASSDPDGGPDGGPGGTLSYRWQFGWPGWDATGPTPSFVFTNPGLYVVALEVTDEDGAMTRVERPVRILGTPAAPPPPAWAGDEVRWDAVPGAEQYRVTVMCTVGAPFVAEAGPEGRAVTVPAGFCGGGVASASLQVLANTWSQPSPGVDR